MKNILQKQLYLFFLFRLHQEPTTLILAHVLSGIFLILHNLFIQNSKNDISYKNL